jgi:uncharacterized membrane protein YcfT
MAEVLHEQGLRPKGQSSASSRLDSLDLARGVLILLVIFVHSYGHNFTDIAGPGTISKVWDVVVSATKPIRMPAFFLISGFLAKSLIRKDWSTLFKKRINFLMYMYAVWLFISLVAFAYIGYARDLQPVNIFEILYDFVAKIALPYSFLWFLWALSLYNILAKATLGLPLWIVLGVAAVISGLSEQLADQPSFILRCAVYFLLGARYPDFVTKLSSWASWRLTAGLLIAYVASVGLIFLLGEKFPGVWLPAGITGSAAVITFATLVSPWPGMPWLKYCGRNTLQLYVLHPIIIGIITFIEIRYFGTMVAWLRNSTLLLSIHPILFVVAVTALSLLIWSTLVRVGLGVLFQAPWSKSRSMQPSVTPAVEDSRAGLTTQ